MLTDERVPEQLRSYFEWLDGELGPIEPIKIGLPAVGSTANERVRSTARRPIWQRYAVAAACLVLVAGTVLAIGLVPRDRTDDVASQPTSPPAEGIVDAPAWYVAIRPFLPAGFEHVTVHHSDDRFVEFIALDPASGKTLHLTVTRRAMTPDPDGSITLEQAEREPWTDVGADLNVSLPDGRQVGVNCGFRALPEGGLGCPAINGQATDPEDLRKLAVALATEVDVSELPEPAPTLDHVPADTIHAAIERAMAVNDDDIFDVEAPHYSTSFVQVGEINSPELVVVHTFTGYYPPLSTETPRRSASADGHRLTWQVAPDGVVWTVADHPGISGHDVADQILDIAAGAAAAVPTALPDGYGIWAITHTGSSGTMRPIDLTDVSDAREVRWSASYHEAVTTRAGDDPVRLANGDDARYRTESGGYQLLTFQRDAGIWIVLTSLGDAIDRDQLVELASSFTAASPDAIATTREQIAARVRSTFELDRTTTIDGTPVELYTLDDTPAAMCIAEDRCLAALGPVESITPSAAIVSFAFQHPDGSADHYALLRGAFDRLEPSVGVTVTTTADAAGTWVHAHRPANVPYGSVQVVNPSDELGDLVGFDL